MQQRKTPWLHAVLALTLTLGGCSGAGNPASPTTTSSTSPTTVTPISTGNATLDGALNSASDVRTALDGIRSLGSSAGSSATTQGFRTAGFSIQEEQSRPAQFQDPRAGGDGSRVEDRKRKFFDGKTAREVTIRIRIVNTQVDPNTHRHQEFDITNGEPGVLIGESLNQRQDDGRIKDTNTNFFMDPQGVLHKMVYIAIHEPFPPNHFQQEPNVPPPPPPDGSNQEFISTDKGQTFTLIATGETKDGVTTLNRKFKDKNGVEVEETSSFNVREGSNSVEHKENGVLVFSHSTKREKVENGTVLIREVDDNVFVDARGGRHRHKSNILRLGDLFGGFAPQPASGQLNTQEVSDNTSSGGNQSSPPSGGAGEQGQQGQQGQGPLPGSGLALIDPNRLPVPPGTIDALIEDFLNDKLQYRLKYHNVNPFNPMSAQLEETHVDPVTGEELPPDGTTVNADGTRTQVRHLPNGNVVTITLDPALPGPPAFVEKTKDGKTLHKLERTATGFTEIFYGPDGKPRHVIRGTFAGNNNGTFEEFNVKDGVEVKVVIGTVVNGKVTRTAPDGTPLNDDYGPSTTQRKQLDGDNEQQETSQTIGGKVVKLIRKVRKVLRQTAGQLGPNGQFEAGGNVESDQVTGVQQVIGDGEATLDFGDDITVVDKTTVTITFKSKGTFTGTISKSSGQANLDGTLTTPDGKTFKLNVTQTIGSLGLTATIVLTSGDGGTQITIDINSDGSGVGVVKDLVANRNVFTISINSKGKATIRDPNDNLVKGDVPLFSRS